ncbi:phosphotransacetylase [Rhodohalobacter mucosus]|uniref:Phosphate acetyltransferase n=1 Tax=Rhodohalobacter mucosus TaxID=2079485 RepID=A0A316TVI2_9BACT|nr:phosphotransacetylase [Rhodohalobacter mucosus]PWN07125.1 phosphate acetyltransferase [Rhodohalobacter mucosus]
MSQIDKIRSRASQTKRKVLLPEAEKDIRVIKAAIMLKAGGYADPVLLGNRSSIQKLAETEGVELPDSLQVNTYSDPVQDERKFLYFKEKLKHKNPEEEQLRELSRHPLYTAGWLLDTGEADASVAGSVASTGDVIRSALRTVGVAESSELVSSSFLMEMPDGRVFTYADCGVVPYPDAPQLASIALDAAKTHQLLTGVEPVIAFLSFSTKGSARHERVDLVTEALRLAKSKKTGWRMDGELQFDAAAVRTVAERKAPDSDVKGDANVFIFPNLDAGNIAYKITERLAGASATGPLLQGLQKPIMDLSRGCSVDDIVNTACVASLLAAT